MIFSHRAPPFYENFDNTHCFQCVLRGVLEHFEPETSWSWEALDALTNKEPGKWTWPYRGLLNMKARGYDLVSITQSSLGDYVELGLYEAMVRKLGVEAADRQREMVDLDVVKKDLLDYYHRWKEGEFVRKERLPTMEDVRQLLDEGYLVGCGLNSRILNGREGYASHLVLVYGLGDGCVYFHDSGLPGVEGRRETVELFEKACVSPTAGQWSLTAYRR